MLKKYFSLFVSSMAIFALLTGCNTTEAAVEEVQQTFTVEVSPVSKNNLDSKTELNGKVNPNQEVNIVPKMGGKVRSVNYKVGDFVKQGDVLFTLDDTDIRLQIQQADVALSNARLNLQKASGGGATELQISQLKTALVNAETQLNNAKTSYDKTKELYEDVAVSKEVLEQVEGTYNVALEQYNTAKASLDLTINKITPENVASAEAGVRQAQVSYNMALSQLDNTVVRSPASGTVSYRKVEVGEMVSAAAPVFTIMDLTSVTVDINVPEDLINKLALNDKVEVNVNGAGINNFEGRISSISPSADQKTQSFPVKVLISNDKNLLKAGMFADVKLTTERIENALAIPLDAVLDSNGKKEVFVAEGDIAKKKEIKVGMTSDSLIQVIEGLEENEQVVVKGQNLLEDGFKINIVK